MNSGLTKEVIFKGLLQRNYFPNQKKDGEEIPPILTTTTITPEIADEFLKSNSNTTRQSGYDQIEYRLTRFNNVSRALSIVHPEPHLRLAKHISDNWDSFKYITENESNSIVPELHDDGRIITMEYEDPETETRKTLKRAFGKKYLVRTDISNFFSSIYSHSIPWALIGHKEAKRRKNEKASWFNELDKLICSCKRGETNGIPIGPATSSILAEVILSKVDKNLREEKFDRFYRYIDDYSFFADSLEKGEEFLRVLSENLATYRLFLNIHKTSIKKLPTSLSEDWVADISTRIPHENKLRNDQAIKLLDYAVTLQEKTPDGSVLKYTAKLVEQKITNGPIITVLDYILVLSLRYPILIPLIEPLLKKVRDDEKNECKNHLVTLLEDNALNRRSDGMCWILYYLFKYYKKIPISEDIQKKVLKTNDCLSILLLYELLKKNSIKISKISDFANNLVRNGDNFELDRYWLLLYQLFLDDKINHPYGNTASIFTFFKDKNISFIDPAR